MAYNSLPHKFDQICGLYHAKRAAEVAMTGTHQILFIGCKESDASALADLTNHWHNHFYTQAYGDPTRIAYYTAPCPCGYYGDPVRECTCGDLAISKWQNSYMGRYGPEIVVQVTVQSATRIMAWLRNGRMNGEVNGDLIVRVERNRANLVQLNTVDDVAYVLMEAAVKSLLLSPQQVGYVMNVANTIACMAGASKIESAHMAEAIQYRPSKYGFGVGG